MKRWLLYTLCVMSIAIQGGSTLNTHIAEWRCGRSLGCIEFLTARGVREGAYNAWKNAAS